MFPQNGMKRSAAKLTAPPLPPKRGLDRYRDKIALEDNNAAVLVRVENLQVKKVSLY